MALADMIPPLILLKLRVKVLLARSTPKTKGFAERLLSSVLLLHMLNQGTLQLRQCLATPLRHLGRVRSILVAGDTVDPTQICGNHGVAVSYTHLTLPTILLV